MKPGFTVVITPFEIFPNMHECILIQNMKARRLRNALAPIPRFALNEMSLVLLYKVFLLSLSDNKLSAMDK
jgi:hypothetical protein